MADAVHLERIEMDGFAHGGRLLDFPFNNRTI